MKYLKYITLVALLAFAVSCSKDDDGENMPPEPTPPVEKPEPQAVTLPQKELRGAWITTVWGIDWPMEDYNAATQQKKYTDYLDLLVANNMNAVFFQIRGMADAFYESQYESWSKNITGTAGWTNSAGVAVLNPGKLILNAVASLTQPIFNNGKLVANLKVSKAEEKIAQMNYQQTILEAGKEVSDALFLYDTQNKKLIEDRGQVDQLDKAVTYTKSLFQSGDATYLEILTAQQNLLSAQLSEVSDNFQRIQAVINLYSALGGGRE